METSLGCGTRLETERIRSRSHSGDDVEVVAQGGNYFVQKTLRSNLERARANIEKQRQFASFQNESARISAAEIVSVSETETSVVVIMPYVSGLSGEALILHSDRQTAKVVSNALSDLVFSGIRDGRVEQVPVAIFLQKLNEVGAALKGDSYVSFLEMFSHYLKGLGSTIPVPLGRCHGDLTLDNVIVSRADRIVLIDFLSTFLESPMQDVGKLAQEFLYGWSTRRSSPATRVRARIFCEANAPAVLDVVSREFPVASFVFTAMTLLRIAPYVRDEATDRWLLASLSTCFNRGRQCES